VQLANFGVFIKSQLLMIFVLLLNFTKMSLVHLLNDCGLSALLIVEVSFEVIFVNVPKFQAFIVRCVLIFQVFLVLSLLFAQFFVVGCELH